jgi:glycosyltransferase involved in cell wall biosynthesis
MADSLFQHPGLIVLHDISLHNFFARQAQAGRLSRYLRALGHFEGAAGTALGRDFWRAFRAINYPDHLASEWLVDCSPGVIVHSQHALSVLCAHCPAAHIERIPMPIPLPPAISIAAARAMLNLADDRFVVGVFGVLNDSKNPTAILTAVRRLVDEGVPITVAFVGRENDTFHLVEQAPHYGLADRVIQPGFIESLQEVNQWLAACDMAISLRALYWGETPSSTLRTLAAGTPVIINTIGAFAELPETACIGIEPTESDMPHALYRALRQSYEQPERRAAQRIAARDYIAREHDPACTARRYVEVAAAFLGAA